MNTEDMTLDLAAMLPKITADVAEQLRTKAVERLQYTVANAIEAEVKLYIAETILPQVRKGLTEHEVEIRAAIVAAIHGASMSLAARITEAATKKMSSYEGDKVLSDIVQKLFGRGH